MAHANSLDDASATQLFQYLKYNMSDDEDVKIRVYRSHIHKKLTDARLNMPRTFCGLGLMQRMKYGFVSLRLPMSSCS